LTHSSSWHGNPGVRAAAGPSAATNSSSNAGHQGALLDRRHSNGCSPLPRPLDRRTAVRPGVTRASVGTCAADCPCSAPLAAGAGMISGASCGCGSSSSCGSSPGSGPGCRKDADDGALAPDRCRSSCCTVSSMSLTFTSARFFIISSCGLRGGSSAARRASTWLVAAGRRLHSLPAPCPRSGRSTPVCRRPPHPTSWGRPLPRVPAASARPRGLKALSASPPHSIVPPLSYR
jgi:hypothetical protein